jgi:hypothetical protein
MTNAKRTLSLLDNHGLRMQYAEMLSLANATILSSRDGCLEPDEAEMYGIVGFVSDSGTQIYVPFTDETLMYEVNPVDYYGDRFLESKFYNPECIDIKKATPTMRILYASEEATELREVIIDAETTDLIHRIGVIQDMGVPEIVDTMFALKNDERAVGYLLSTDGDEEARHYLNLVYDLYEGGYVYEDQEKVLTTKEDFIKLKEDLSIAIGAYLTQPEENFRGLPAMFIEVFGRRVEVPMNADLYETLTPYIDMEIDTH